jgi:organic radical activating enzyme
MQVRGRKPIPKQRSIRYELTGVCNYLCNYCSYNNTFNLGKHSVIWKEVVNWCNKYNSISKLSNELILWGGEPTLHPDFWQVIDSVQIPFGLYTNFSQDINFWNQLLCYNHLCQIIATYHSTKISADEFIKKVYYFNKKI